MSTICLGDKLASSDTESDFTKAASLIDDERAIAIIQLITYDMLDEHYGTNMFTELTIKGKLGTIAMKAKKYLSNYIVYDFSNEQKYTTELDTNADAVYAKLPDGFHISILVGCCNLYWRLSSTKARSSI